MSHTYPVNITCISWLFLWCAILLPLKLLTWLPIIGFKATALRTFVPLIYYHWEPNHNGKCNQCGYLAETGVLKRERGGHLASDSSRRLNRSQPFCNSRPQCWGRIERTPLVGVCKDDNMTIVFLPPVEEKSFIRLQNPFKGLRSPGKAHGKHRTHWHLNLPVEKKP